MARIRSHRHEHVVGKQGHDLTEMALGPGPGPGLLRGR